jgi:hypothetical protein
MPVFSKVMYDESGNAYQFRDGKRINIEITYPPGQKIRRKREGTFAVVPLQWAAKGLIAMNTPKAVVLVWLIYRSWQRKSPTFDVPNGALAGLGVSPDAKVRALRQLATAGLIKVEWRLRKSPIVTLLGL